MSFLKNFIHLFYPQLCFACLQHSPMPKSSICTHCHYKIRPTNYHLLDTNPVLERFWGRVELHHATSIFTFTKGGILQNLIHQLKYKKRPQIGLELGKMTGNILKKSPYYQDIDYIIPVPLHPKKEHIRGYNQAAKYAQGIAETLDTEWSGNFLIRNTHTESQTKKSRLERFENVMRVLEVRNMDALTGKHLLLVDDVITTGATLEACSIKLLEIANTKVSLASIALATH